MNVVDLKLGPFVRPTFYDLLDCNLDMRSRYSRAGSIKGLQVGVSGARRVEILPEVGQNLLSPGSGIYVLFVPSVSILINILTYLLSLLLLVTVMVEGVTF